MIHSIVMPASILGIAYLGLFTCGKEVWFASGSSIHRRVESGLTEKIASVRSGIFGQLNERAHLIAAAPEMYAACQKALARGCSCNCNMGKEWHSDACSIPLIRAALDKTTGVKP